MHVATDLCAQAVDNLIQGLGAGGVHADEELKLVFVRPRGTGLDVPQVDALVLWLTEKTRGDGETSFVWVLKMLLVKGKRCIVETKWRNYMHIRDTTECFCCSTALVPPPEGVVLLLN